MVTPELAATVTQSVQFPTIGIGAGTECDGQIIVMHDILGLTPTKPPFAKIYADVKVAAVAAISAYRDDVRAKKS